MADSRRRSSSGGRLSGCRSWSFEDRVLNLLNGGATVGLEVEVEEEDRLWWEKRVLGDFGGLGGLVGEDLNLSFDGDFGGLVGDLCAVEEGVRGEVGVCSRSQFWSLSFSFS